MKNYIILILASTLLAAAGLQAATTQSVSGADGFGVFSSSGGGGSSSGTFIGPSDIGAQSWGFFASSSELSEALYDIQGGALEVGQKLTVEIDNSSVQAGGSVGISFQNIDQGNNRLEVFFIGGQTNYTVQDSAPIDSGVGFTTAGLTIEMTLTGTDTYSIDITPNGSGTTNLTGTLGGTAGTGIDRFRFFNFNAGDGSSFDFFGNNLSVVPEPSTYAALAGLGVLALALLRRRR